MNCNRVQRALEVRNHPEPRLELTAAATQASGFGQHAG
jgi:hypothetical protein